MSLEKQPYIKFKTGEMYKGYLDLQDKYSKIYGTEKTIVLIQIGDFHECYSTPDRGFDLQKLGSMLNVTVSRKNKKKANTDINNPYMIGFPVRATAKYVNRLTDCGFHVIKIDQVTRDDPPKRQITGIYSAATNIDGVADYNLNYILSLYIEEITQLDKSSALYIGLSAIDLSIGKSLVHEIFSKKNDDKYSLDECIKFINNLNPKDIIINTKNLNSFKKEDLLNYFELKEDRCIFEEIKTNEFEKVNYQNQILGEIYEDTYSNPIDDLNLERMINGRLSFVLLLNYCFEQNNSILKNLSEPEFFNNDQFLHLGNNALMQ